MKFFLNCQRKSRIDENGNECGQIFLDGLDCGTDYAYFFLLSASVTTEPAKPRMRRIKKRSGGMSAGGSGATRPRQAETDGDDSEMDE